MDSYPYRNPFRKTSFVTCFVAVLNDFGAAVIKLSESAASYEGFSRPGHSHLENPSGEAALANDLSTATPTNRVYPRSVSHSSSPSGTQSAAGASTDWQAASRVISVGLGLNIY